MVAPLNLTPIEWTDASWNPFRGCSRCSPGCLNCYAERQAIRQRKKGYSGLVTITNGKPAWTGKVRVVEDKLVEPLRWQDPKRIFANSMSDMFHPRFPDSRIDEGFAVMAAASWHTFQVLTKRADRMASYFNMEGHDRKARAHRWLEATWKLYRTGPEPLRKQLGRVGWSWANDGFSEWPLPNIWLGVSVEDQKRKHRIDELRATPAAVRFLSLEPLLEDLGELNLDRIHWVIIGAESGPNARPFNVMWAHRIIEQCRAQGVAVFVKQIGPDPIDDLGKMRGAMVVKASWHKKGGNIDQWPKWLQIREYPKVTNAN